MFRSPINLTLRRSIVSGSKKSLTPHLAVDPILCGPQMTSNSIKALRNKLLIAGLVLGGLATQYNVADCASDSDAEGVSKFVGDAIAKAIPSGSNGNGGDDGRQLINSLIEKYSGVLSKLGFSGFMGLCSGVAFVKVSKEVAIAIGSVFAGLQVLAYMGYITIDYKKVTDDAERALDVTGDGKFNQDDIKYILHRMTDILIYQLPNAAGFCSGLALGIYYSI